MDIYAKPGTKVKFLGCNGYEFELQEAMKTFVPGEILTVDNIEVGGWSSSAEFEEFPGRWNTVMFGDVE